MDLIKEKKFYYDKPENINVFYSYFSVEGEPIYRTIGKNEDNNIIKLRNNMLFNGEDPRPFKLANEEYIVSQRFHGDFKTVENYIVNVNKGDNYLYKVNRNNFFYGKNWTPFVYNNELYILHRFDPFTVIKNGNIIIEIQMNLPNDSTDFCQYRGGSNGLQIDDNIVVGFGHRTYTNYDHMPFIWILDFKNKTIEIMNLINYEKKERINDPTSLWKENNQIYLSIFESSKRWHDHDLNCRSLIYKINLEECIEKSKISDYYKHYF